MSFEWLQYRNFVNAMKALYNLSGTHIVPENKYGFPSMIISGDTPEDLISIGIRMVNESVLEQFETLNGAKEYMQTYVSKYAEAGHFYNFNLDNTAFSRLYEWEVEVERKNHKIINLWNKSNRSLIKKGLCLEYNKKESVWVVKDGTTVPFKKMRGEGVVVAKANKLSLRWVNGTTEPSTSPKGVITLPHGLNKNTMSYCKLLENTDTRVVFEYYKWTLFKHAEERHDRVSKVAKKYTIEFDGTIKRDQEVIGSPPEWTKSISCRSDFERNPLNTPLHDILPNDAQYVGPNIYQAKSGAMYIKYGNAWCFAHDWWVDSHFCHLPEAIQEEYKAMSLVKQLMK